MSSATGTASRRHELDQLRILATLGVIALHTGAMVVVAWQDSTPDLWSKFNVGNAADAVGRFAVDCFFLTSGALLLDPARRFRLGPQLRRVAWPTLTWIVVYLAANVALNAAGLIGVQKGLRDPAAMSTEEIVRALLAGPAVYHLWFVYVLLAIYLVVPLLRPITERPEPDRRRLLSWLLTLWLVTIVVQRWAPFFLGDLAPTVYPSVLRNLPTDYLGLFVLGFVLSHYRHRLTVPRLVWPVVAAVGLAWTFTSVWLAAHAGEDRVFAGYGNFTPPVLLYSLGVFLFFLTRPHGAGPTGPWVRRVSDLTFRVYLLHALVLHLLKVATGLGDLTIDRPWIGVPLIFSATVLISFAIAWALDQVRVLRRWI